jgi:hypothetical protein
MRPVKLVPQRLPGPNARKARAYAAELVQLRAQGYTFEAIREALAAAGLQVSNSTVQREVARMSREPATAAPRAPAVVIHRHPQPSSQPTAAPAHAMPESADAAVPSAWRRGQDVAEAYTRELITNPLIRATAKR